MSTFESLGLSEVLIRALEEKGYSRPTPIQTQAIPPILKGQDIMASAQTGTGKTAGFTLPILQRLGAQQGKGKRIIRALILTPTRELAAQIQDNVEEYAKHSHLRSAVIFGGVNQNPQVRRLQSGVDVLIATPGRLLDLEGQGHLRLDRLDFFVLDEADRMLDMGFARDIHRVLDLIPQKRQTLLFSATFSKDIKKLAQKLLYKPVSVNTNPENSTADRVAQRVLKVDKGDKANLLTSLISNGDWSQVLVFTRTKHGANRLSQRLDRKKISSAAIHGNKSQGARTKALAGFKNGSIRVLVATDIAARGLDIPLLPHVVNYELPNVPEDYVHRIGRTGRAGADGEALSLVCAEERDYLKNIEKLLGESIPYDTHPDFEPTEDPASIPPIKGNGGGRGRQGGGRRNGLPRRNSGQGRSKRKPARRY